MIIKIKKIPLSNSKKRIALVMSFIIMCLSIFLIYKILSPQKVEEQTTLYTYSLNVNSSYQVHLKENQIYNETILGEDVFYPKSVFDKLNVKFSADFLGYYNGTSSANSNITTNYIIEANVRGYQMKGDEKVIVYEKVFPLLTKTNIEFENQKTFNDEISINFQEYEDYVTKVEEVLNVDPYSEAVLVFKGDFSIKTEYGNKDEKFEYSIPLPIFNNLFTIEKPKAIEKTASITETNIIETSAAMPLLIIPTSLIVVMILLIIYIIKFTIPLSKDENMYLHFKNIMRKYGSRIIGIKSFVNAPLDTVFEIKDIDGLVKISDEYSIPILYISNKDNMPEGNKMFVPSKDICYIYIAR